MNIYECNAQNEIFILLNCWNNGEQSSRIKDVYNSQYEASSPISSLQLTTEI